MVSIASFKSSSIQNDDTFINYGPLYFKIEDKAGYVLGLSRQGGLGHVAHPLSLNKLRVIFYLFKHDF